MKKMLKNYYLTLKMVDSMDDMIEKSKPLFRNKTDFVECAIDNYLYLLGEAGNSFDFGEELNEELETLKRTEKYKKAGKQLRAILIFQIEEELRLNYKNTNINIGRR